MIGIRALRILRYFLGACVILTVGYGIYIFTRWFQLAHKYIEENKRVKIEGITVQSDPVKRLAREIEKYLRENKSTDFFRENLLAISKHMQIINKQVEGVEKVAAKRFYENSLSYNQFVQPVRHLFEHLINLGEDLIDKLDMFDEERYQHKIDELAKTKSLGEVNEYEEVMSNYIEYTNAIVSSFENTVIKLDKLILEIGKLSNEELLHSVFALQELNTVIANTKLYGD
jgi:uncharacterized protein YutE (UPF0331/DUF86 family)